MEQKLYTVLYWISLIAAIIFFLKAVLTIWGWHDAANGKSGLESIRYKMLNKMGASPDVALFFAVLKSISISIVLFAISWVLNN